MENPMPIKAQEVAKFLIMYGDWETVRKESKRGVAYHWHAPIDGIASRESRTDLLNAFKEFIPSARIVRQWNNPPHEPNTRYPWPTKRFEWMIECDSVDIKPVRYALLNSRDKQGRYVERLNAERLNKARREK
jgi:hypothetical protein